jgi:hypothetical protein
MGRNRRLVLAAACVLAGPANALPDDVLQRVWAESFSAIREPKAIARQVDSQIYYFMGACIEPGPPGEPPSLTARRLRALDKHALLNLIQQEQRDKRVSLAVSGLQAGPLQRHGALQCLLAYVQKEKITLIQAAVSTPRADGTERVDVASSKAELLAEAKALGAHLAARGGTQPEYRLLHRLYLAAGDLEGASQAMDSVLREAGKLNP